LLLACQGEAPNPATSEAPSAGSAGQVISDAGQGGSAGAPLATSGNAGQLASNTSGQGGGAGSAGGTLATAGASGSSAGSGGDRPMLPKRVLLYHFSTLDIPSVPAQITLLSEQLTTWGYEVKDSVSSADLSAESLAGFAAVGMINTCFEPFGKNNMGEAETAALKSFVEGGGGLFGTHCATVTFQAVEPPHPYNGVIGGRGGHGFFNGSSACRTTEQHATTAMLPATFDYMGDLDNADYVAPDAKVLVKCKWSGGEQKDTAVSWYRTPGKGRVFYTNFAKEDVDLNDVTLGDKHILPGLGWVLGR
jgi:type 1 glutamine amidotransferase